MENDQYYVKLTVHPDLNVRNAAKRCLAMYKTPEWKSRYKRILLDELSWALHDYLEAKQKDVA